MRQTKFKTQRHRHLFFVDMKRKALQGQDKDVAMSHHQIPNGVNRNMGEKSQVGV